VRNIGKLLAAPFTLPFFATCLQEPDTDFPRNKDQENWINLP
jgi:hypothetical protein